MKNKDKSSSVKETSEARRGGFFVVMLGKDAVWIDEQYQLYRNPKDTVKDEYFLLKDRQEFINNEDTIKIIVEKQTYLIQFRCEMSDEMKVKIAHYIHNNQTTKEKVGG